MDTPVIVADPETLRAVVTDVVQETMVEQVPEAIRQANLPEWLSRPQAKERYGLTDRQLTYMRNNRSIEFSKHGRRIYYRRASLDAWFDEGRVPARRRDEP